MERSVTLAFALSLRVVRVVTLAFALSLRVVRVVAPFCATSGFGVGAAGAVGLMAFSTSYPFDVPRTGLIARG